METSLETVRNCYWRKQTGIGEDGVKAHDKFTWSEGENQEDIALVLQKFNQFCAPRTQVIYESYRFNNRNQEPGENVSTYLTELRTITRNCAHDTITPEEILRDRLVLGIHDDRVRERLLRLNDLSLQQTVDIIKSSEQTQQQVKQMSGGDTLVHALKKFGPAVQVEDEKSIIRLQEERLKNVEIEEWFTDEIVQHMEEHVSTVET